MLDLRPFNVDVVDGLHRNEVGVFFRIELTTLLHDWVRELPAINKHLLQGTELAHLVGYLLAKVFVFLLAQLQVKKHLCKVDVCVVVYSVELFEDVTATSYLTPLSIEIELVGVLPILLVTNWLERCLSLCKSDFGLVIFNQEVHNLHVEVAQAELFLFN